jgi:hypothetical protein
MKYLYPYECEKLKLSNPSELQSAIDGNRREGRRSSYGYDLSPGPTLVPTTHPLNGSMMNGKLGRGSPGEREREEINIIFALIIETMCSCLCHFQPEILCLLDVLTFKSVILRTVSVFIYLHYAYFSEIQN